MARYGMNNNGDTWVSVDSKEIGDTATGCLWIAIPLMIISFIAALTEKAYNIVNNVGDYLLVKILLFPTFWDGFVPALEDSKFITFLLLIISLIVVEKLMKKVRRNANGKKTLLFTYLRINNWLLFIRIAILFVYGIVQVL